MLTEPIAVLDVGGSFIKTGLVRGAAVELGATFPALSTAAAEVVLGQLASATTAALGLGGDSVVGLAISVPGPFDIRAGVALMRDVHKFESIYELELRHEIRARTAIADLPIEFVHDNDAAGVGEARAGAGVGYGRVFTITLGTGVGSCLTERGQLVDKVGDLTIELLAMRPTQWGRADDVLSARGLAKRLNVAMADLPQAVADPSSYEIVADHGHRVGTFLSPVAKEVDADVVVIGGGLSAAFDRFGPSLCEALHPVECLPATLGARGPLLGAAQLAFSTPHR